MNILRRYSLILAIAAGVAVWWFFIRDEEGPEPEPEPEPTLDGEITALSGTASPVTSEIAYSVSIKNTGTIATSYRARTVFTAGSRTPSRYRSPACAEYLAARRDADLQRASQETL